MSIKGSRMSVLSGLAAREQALVAAPPPRPGPAMHIRGDWPLRSDLEVGALPSAVPCARARTRQVLWEWGLAGCSEQVELLVSELLTNAVKASRSLGWHSPVRLWVLSDKAHVLVLVWDANPQPPMRIEAGRGGRERPASAPRRSHQRPVGLVSARWLGRQGGVGESVAGLSERAASGQLPELPAGIRGMRCSNAHSR